MIIIGMGPGLSFGMAERFGKAGYQIGMISRNADKLGQYQKLLSKAAIKSEFETADLSDTSQLLTALGKLREKLPQIHVLHYNAVDARMIPLLEESAESLSKSFLIGVANALEATKALLADLQANQGSVLLTGGGTSKYPNAAMGSISLSKAGIRSMAFQLHDALKSKGIYVGTLTVSGEVSPDSKTHSPQILAEKFWDMNQERKSVELTY